MSILRLLSAAALLTLATSVSASSFVITTDWTVKGVGSSSDASASSSKKDNKVILAAREDAASFVASQGAIRGAHLEAALAHIHQQQPGLQASDAQLAEAILAN